MDPSGSQIGTTGWICPIFLFLGRRMEECSLKTDRGRKGLVVWRDSIFWGHRPAWHVSCFHSQQCRSQSKEEGKNDEASGIQWTPGQAFQGQWL